MLENQEIFQAIDRVVRDYNQVIWDADEVYGKQLDLLGRKQPLWRRITNVLKLSIDPQDTDVAFLNCALSLYNQWSEEFYDQYNFLGSLLKGTFDVKSISYMPEGRFTTVYEALNGGDSYIFKRSDRELSVAGRDRWQIPLIEVADETLPTVLLPEGFVVSVWSKETPQRHILKGLGKYPEPLSKLLHS